MKIERFMFGMWNGKIGYVQTDGVTNLITDQNLQYLRDLEPRDSGRYLWLPTEQIVAYPHIVEVSDGHGRTFVQNETLLIPIHTYLKLTNPGRLFRKHFSTSRELPDMLEPAEIE